VEPGLLRPVLIAQTHTLRELSAQTDTGTRQQVPALGSRYAEYVGWHVEFLAEGGDEDEAGGVELRRASSAAGAAGAPGRGFALRTVVSFHRACGLVGRQFHHGGVSEASRTTRRF
jgi:hypothetical protein